MDVNLIIAIIRSDKLEAVDSITRGSETSGYFQHVKTSIRGHAHE